MSDIEKHPFEPFLPENARILFLGSFPPQPKRWSMVFYYPNWINDFWRIAGLVFFGERDYFCIPSEKRFDLEKIVSFCKGRGLAFYDTACAVRRLRDNASDKFLEVVTPADIPALLGKIPQCSAIVTTGEKATDTLAEACRCQKPAVGHNCGKASGVLQDAFHQQGLSPFPPGKSRSIPQALPCNRSAAGHRWESVKTPCP